MILASDWAAAVNETRKNTRHNNAILNFIKIVLLALISHELAGAAVYSTSSQCNPVTNAGLKKAAFPVNHWKCGLVIRYSMTC